MKNILFYARNIITVPTGAKTTRTMNDNWSDYDKSVATSHLNNYGKIYLDGFGSPIDDYDEVDSIRENSNEALAATAIKNLENFGFTIGQEGFDMLSTASKKDITDWYYDTQAKLKELCGANHVYRPFYPNFPEEVINKSELERFVEQIAHYAFGYRPDYENEKENIESLEAHKLKTLNVIDANDTESINQMAKEIFKNLLKTKQNLPISDIENVVLPYINKVNNWTKDATVIGNRNLMCLLYAMAIDKNKDTSMLPNMVTNDYLRLAKIMSYHKKYDVYPTNLMILEDIKLSSMPRRFRRFIAEGLDSQKNLEEDVARNKTQFKVLFKLIHANEFVNCESLKEVVRKVRNNERLETFYSRIERAFADKDFNKVIALYGSRPGEFIKNFNRMITYPFTTDKDELKAFAMKLIETSKKVFEKTRPEDLINFLEYINSRTREGRIPIYNVKGKLLLRNDKEYMPINKTTCKHISGLAKEALINQVKGNAEYGKVYIDNKLNKIVMPKDIKDASQSMCSYTKGSRIQPELTEDGKAKNIRFHVWWTNPKHTILDIDLSAELLIKENLKGDEKLGTFFLTEDNKKLVCTRYVNFRNHYNVAGVTHSGDIVNGGDINGKGVCEYIDLNVNELRNNNIAYVKLFINNYSGLAYNEIPNCELGWQEREELDRTKQFDPRAVKQRSKPLGEFRGITPCIYDVENNEIIWCDTPDYKITTCGHIESTSVIQSTDIIMERYATMDRITQGEMAELVALAQGCEIVDSPEKADTVFVVDDYADKTENQRVITCKDLDVWIGEFMTPKADDVSEEQKIEQEAEVEKTSQDVQMNSILDFFDNSPDINVDNCVNGDTSTSISNDEVKTEIKSESRDEELDFDDTDDFEWD